jgi:hypothetical protein
MQLSQKRAREFDSVFNFNSLVDALKQNDLFGRINDEDYQIEEDRDLTQSSAPAAAATSAPLEASSDDVDSIPDDDDDEDYNAAPHPSVTFWCLAMGDFMRHYRVKYKEEIETQRIPLRNEAALDLAFKRKRHRTRTEESADKCPGDARVRRIRELYTGGFKQRIRPGDDDGAFRVITPSDDQLLFLEACLFACLPKIYGTDDWAVHHERVLNEWGRKEIDYYVMMITARRVGKTFSMSMFDAAYILTVPGQTIAVFSTGKRASKMLKELVEKFVFMSGETNARRIILSTDEELLIAEKPVADGMSKRAAEVQALRIHPGTSALKSYPSNIKGKSFNTEAKKHFICGCVLDAMCAFRHEEQQEPQEDHTPHHPRLSSTVHTRPAPGAPESHHHRDPHSIQSSRRRSTRRHSTSPRTPCCSTAADLRSPALR